MVWPVIKAVELQLPEVLDYLDSRIVRTTHIPKALNTAIKSEMRYHTAAFGEYG